MSTRTFFFFAMCSPSSAKGRLYQMLILSPFKRAVRVERTRRLCGRERTPFSHRCLKWNIFNHLRHKHTKMKKWHFLCYRKNVASQPLSLGLHVMSEDSNLLLGVE